MIIEILEKGGIYGYFNGKEYLYIGKTCRDFKERDSEHKKGTTLFEKFYQENEGIEFKILFDASSCGITLSQLDYLETCFIKALNPIFNKQKKDIDISQTKNKTYIRNDYKNLTKSEILILDVIKNFHKDFITKKEIKNYASTKLSSKTIDRAIKKIIDLKIISLTYVNGHCENVYKILEKNNEY